MSIGPDPDDPLVVEVCKDGSSCPSLIRLRGELDVATAPRLERRLDTLIHRGVRHLVVDLADLSFCDLAGLRVLMGADRQLQAHGERLTLFGPCPWLSRISTALNLRDQLPIQSGAGSDGGGQNGAASQRLWS